MDQGSAWIVAATVASVAAAAVAQVTRRRLRQRRDTAALADAVSRQQHLARSLHPVIDPDVCIGSLSCLKACPEGDILGIVDGAARLVHADHCIGHGRCAAECPVGAIRLVFGSSERGVDLPEVDEFFESSRPGVHVVGELGGMGLIKNAARQGLQVAERLAEIVPRGSPPVVVVGAGPAGIATAIGLKARGVHFRVVDQGTVGGSVAHYPRQKVAMTEAIELPGVGRIGKRLVSKEELLETWDRALDKTGVRVEEGVKVVGIEGEDGAFTVVTPGDRLAAAKVVLAIGRRGTPRRLGVPGEDSEKVTYGLLDAEQYDRKRVLVVGGGDAALEAAIQIAEKVRAQVTISYRGEAFAKCREANRRKMDALVDAGRVRALLPSTVKEVRAREVILDSAGASTSIENDYVIACLGGELPVEFLKSVGVGMKRYHGEAPGQAGAAKQHRARADAQRAHAERVRRWSFRAAYALAGLAILGFLAWKGWDYYFLTRPERLRSPVHPWMKPAGHWGHGVGIVATLFMLSNFLYAVRKRSRALTGLGTIVGWLDFHVFVGFMSPLVIAFHAAFQSNNELATGTATALIVVVATGMVGRFIYGQVPSDRGKILEMEELTARFERLRDEAAPLLATAGARAEALLARATRPVGTALLPVVLVRMPLEALALRFRLRLLRGRFRDAVKWQELRDAIVRMARLRWQIRAYGSLKRLLRGWRVFHASLAVFLVLAIVAHIAVSLYLGYGLK